MPGGDMKFICLGNNTELTDKQTTSEAIENNSINNGLLSDLDNTLNVESLSLENGYYHTSVYDIDVSKLKELVKKFDSVVVLDQPLEIWSHPDSFYKTVDFALELQTHVKWKNKKMSENILYWKTLVEKNKSFCIFPFIELLADNNSTKVCCRSNKEITPIKNLKSFQYDERYNKIRKSLLQGEKIPEHCSSCYDLENKGITSARQQETIEWANRLQLESTDDLHKIESPAYIEVRPSNVCNLQCRMCSPKWSNKIEKEFKKIGLIDANNSTEYTGFDIVDFSNLKKLYVAGGEPTAMPEFYTFLKKCIQEKNTDFEFLVNTNAAKISQKLLDLGSKFSNLQYTVSIDGFSKANDYIRWGSDWGTVTKNIRTLHNQHKINFNITLSIYGIFYLTNLIQYLESNFSDCLIHLQYAEFKNDILSPYSFKHGDSLHSELFKLKNTNNYNSNLLFKTFIDNIISESAGSSFNRKKMHEFFEYNDILDKSRASNLNDYIPELEKLKKSI